jgi:hypothetical protein
MVARSPSVEPLANVVSDMAEGRDAVREPYPEPHLPMRIRY